MESLLYRVVTKMNLDEITHNPNAKVVARFEHAGLECVVLNMRDRYYTGYVKTPFDGHHREFEDAVDVHGGLSYGLDDDGWVGFDTAEAFDLAVAELGQILKNAPFGDELQRMDETREWDPDEVMEETARLAEQFAEIVPSGTLQVDSDKIGE
jgi:hypothetical protein